MIIGQQEGRMIIFFVPLFLFFFQTFAFAECLDQDKVPGQFVVRLKKVEHGEFLPQAANDDLKFKLFLNANKINSQNIFNVNEASFTTFNELQNTPPTTYAINASNDQLEKIKLLPYVDTVEQDCYYKIQGEEVKILQTTNDPKLGELWGMKKIKADLAWDINKGLASVITAVSDTGVDYNHEDLKKNMWINTKEIPNNGVDDDNDGCIDGIYGCDFADNDGNPMPDNKDLVHGTHVAGTVAAVGDNGIGVTGVVQVSKIMALKGFNTFAQGDGTALLQTIYYAVNNGARVINCSWGRKGTVNQADRDAFAYAHSRGVVVVVAAGNNNQDAFDFIPANLPNVITVAATDSVDQIATFSNWGTTIELAAPGGKGYDMAGQTEDGILSTLPNNTYGKFIGTSMAAPHVAGLATLILSINPNLTPADVLKIMQDSGDSIDVTTFSSNRKFKYKRINALNAAQATVATLNSSGSGGGVCLPGQICKTNNGFNVSTDIKNAFTQGGGCGSIKNTEQKKGPNTIALSLLLLPLLLAFSFRLYLIDQKQ